MLDEFGSENKDDYIAGFPPHPHRGKGQPPWDHPWQIAVDFRHFCSRRPLALLGTVECGEVCTENAGKACLENR